MTAGNRYANPLDSERLDIPVQFDATLVWEYADGCRAVLDLYGAAKLAQWDGESRIDWRRDLDAENPAQLPDTAIPIFGSDVFQRLGPQELSRLRRHYQSWQHSQFLHGEQGALLAAAKLVQQAPTLEAKYAAATQVIDEARHVEVYARLLHDKLGLFYPVTPALRGLLENVLADSRWDMTCLGVHVLIEGMAHAATARIRDQSESQLVSALHAYVMQDEARHAAIWRAILGRYYAQLSAAERETREAFVVEAGYALCEGLYAEEVWANTGLPVDQCVAYMRDSALMRSSRDALFSRIVPTMKAVGLWGPRIRGAYRDMGVMGFSELDPDAVAAADARVAHQFDLRRFVQERPLVEDDTSD
jgi:hypothetical protein